MRRCFLILGLTGALAVPLVAAPATTMAANPKKTIKKLSKAVKADHAALGVLSTKLTNLTTQLGTVSSTLGPIAAGAGAIQSALTTLSNAIQNPTTGLPGLNAARTQFGAFKGDGTIIAGTGQSPPAKGPSANAGHPATGTYVVDFGNDVSKRFISVQPAPAANAPIGQGVDCANAGGACPSGDTSANHVLVTIEGHVPCTATPCAPVAPADAPFSVAAISG